MRLEDVVYNIEEDIKIGANLSLASSHYSFVKRMKNDEFLTRVIKECSEDPILYNGIHERLDTLCKVETDPDYSNPNDTFMAVYIYILWASQGNLAFNIVHTFSLYTEYKTNIFWAPYTAKYLLEQEWKAPL